jgi:hypothetical protein
MWTWFDTLMLWLNGATALLSAMTGQWWLMAINAASFGLMLATWVQYRRFW